MDSTKTVLETESRTNKNPLEKETVRPLIAQSPVSPTGINLSTEHHDLPENFPTKPPSLIQDTSKDLSVDISNISLIIPPFGSLPETSAHEPEALTVKPTRDVLTGQKDNIIHFICICIYCINGPDYPLQKIFHIKNK